MNQTYHIDRDILEARFGLAIKTRLDSHLSKLPRDTAERLRASREQALALQGKPLAASARVRQAYTQHAHAHTPAFAGLGFHRQDPHHREADGLPGHEQGGLFQHFFTVLLPLLVLFLGLIALQDLHHDRYIFETASLDVALLSDDLPPDAYTDEGFSEFLKVQAAETRLQ